MPDDIEFLTKPALATGMIIRALRRRGAGPVGGRRRGLRRRPRPARRAGTPPDRLRAGGSAATAASRPRPGRCAPTRSPPACPAGPGSGSPPGRGERTALLRLGLGRPPRPRRQHDPADPVDTQCWWLLIRRHRHTGELAFYRCYSPHPVPLRELVRVAGRRWTVEESFQAGKGLAGLDEHQVRALDLLAALDPARDDRPRPARRDRRPRAHPPARTRRADRADLQRDPPPVHHLVIEPSRTLACPMAWSRWRRRHQHRARTSHYQRQEAAPDHGHNDLRLEY